MINFTVDIELPDSREHIILSEVSIMRLEETNELGEHKYNYGGSWKDKDKQIHYFHGYIFNKRENMILSLVQKVCDDIINRK